jgi:hypothetical protein
MSESTVELIILPSITILCSLVFHWRLRDKLVIASAYAAFISNVVFQLANLTVNGSDPFFIIAMLTGSAISFFIALLIGAVLKMIRHFNEE